ncbi:FAD-dependent oxidoreductase [Thermomicrobium sp. CFH 73360]|uniref:FAD-dependent oxidoreductase n=1 Tax=Thermomicrobium sp. CFH 73360 TaxID=2951987 RepID=UPI002076732C|nr:FAD-dependent oxidoreductase [Thermomicrobium sp. CFH 73360]MCM8745042.1 FAD-dependent oxidoreductase [Thermomicrobium sp. CFH 73360]
MPLDYVQQLRELFDGPGTLSELAFYLHAPAQTDSSFAPPGHESLYILVPVPHLGRPLSNWSNDAREAFRQRVLTTLEYVHGFTNLQESLQAWAEWTPIEFDRIYRSMYGAAFAFEPTLFQSAYFRPHNRSGLPGLYFVGAGTHPGAGIPGVLLSAAVTSSLILSEMPAEAPSKAVIVPKIVERGQL